MKTESLIQFNKMNQISPFQISNREGNTIKKKKIILSRSNIPKINIRIDSLIKQTFNNISTGKLKYYTEGKSTNSNPVFFEYIKSIYQIYQIKDPIQKYHNLQQRNKKYNKDSKQQKNVKNNYNFKEISLSTVLKTETQSKYNNKLKNDVRRTQPAQQIYNSSKSKLYNFKKSPNIQKNHLQNIRKIQTYRKFEQKKNISNLKQQYKQQSNKKSNTKQEFNQFTHIKKNLKKNSIQGKTTEIAQNNSSKSKKNISFGTPDIKYRQSPQSQQQNLTDRIDSFSLKMNQVDQTKQIKPIFRYCFMCENPILESNILIHQKQCPEFKNLYTAHPQFIVKILINKIQRIKQQIEGILLQNQSNSIQKVKFIMKQWMICVQKSYRNGNFNKQYQQTYRKLNSGLNMNFLKLLQLSHKLKWFLKIRQQLKIKFQI